MAKPRSKIKRRAKNYVLHSACKALMSHMTTFQEYQVRATQSPVSLRNNRDRIELPVLGLQEEAGRIGGLLTAALTSGKLLLADKQRDDLRNRMGDILWFVAMLCKETGLSMEDVAAQSLEQVALRTKRLDPDRR